MVESSRMPITCETSGKLLARLDAQTLYLWCKVCKDYHGYSFAALLKIMKRADAATH